MEAGRSTDQWEEVKLPVLLTGTHGHVTPPIPTCTLGSYRASTSSTPIWPADPQQEILDLGVLRNQLAHAQSVFVSHSKATVYGAEPDFVTLVIPGNEHHLPNRVAMGGAAETFVAGTSRSVPAIGAVVNGIPYTPTAQTTYLSLTDSPAACNVSIPPLDWDQQFTTVWPFRDVRQYLPPEVPLDSDTSLSESSSTRAAASAESGAVDTASTTFVELRLDEMPGLRTHLRRLINRRRSKLRRVLKRRQAVSIRRPRPARRNLTLVLLAVSRRYGRRSESDDYALPAHQSTSVTGGEPALNR